MKEIELKEIIHRLVTYRGNRGAFYLYGKEALQGGYYPSWVSQRVSEENSGYASYLVEVATGIIRDRKSRILYGRANFHLVRLLGSSSSYVEQEFAKAFIDQAPDIFSLLDDEVDLYPSLANLRDVIQAEGDNASFWWTVCPYLYQLLRECKISPTDSIRILMNWAANTTSGPTGVELTLPGAEWIPWEKYGFVLVPGDKGAWTHETAMMIASYLLPVVSSFQLPVGRRM